MYPAKACHKRFLSCISRFVLALVQMIHQHFPPHPRIRQHQHPKFACISAILASLNYSASNFLFVFLTWSHFIFMLKTATHIVVRASSSLLNLRSLRCTLTDLQIIVYFCVRLMLDLVVSRSHVGKPAYYFEVRDRCDA